VPKKRSEPQKIGNEGEGAFIDWANKMGWEPTKLVPDPGIDFVCQIPGRKLSKTTEEMPGQQLNVSVRSTKQDSKSVTINRDDAELVLSSNTLFLLALVRRAPLGQVSKVAIRFPDAEFIREIQEFLDTEKETHAVRFSDAVTDSAEIQQRVQELLKKPYMTMITLTRIEHRSRQFIDEPRVEILYSERGVGAYVHSEATRSRIEVPQSLDVNEVFQDIGIVPVFISESLVVAQGSRLSGVDGNPALPPAGKASRPVSQELIGSICQTEDVPTAMDQIRDEVAVWNYDRALALVERVEASLNDDEGLAGSLLPQLLILLARVHVIRAEMRDSDAKDQIEHARSLLSRIDSIPVTAPTDEFSIEVPALRGAIENLERGPDAALALLGGRIDPYAIRVRLAMFINKRDLDRAIALIEDLPKQLHWCDLAVTAYALKDRRDETEKILHWVRAQHDHNKYRQCVVRLANALLARSLQGQDEGKIIHPYALSDEERGGVREVLAILGLVVDPLVSTGHISSELDLAAIRLAWQANHLLGRREDVAHLAELMYARRPVPLEVARSVVTSYIEPPSDLPERLRSEHPGDFDTGILAVVIQSAHMGQHDEAFAQAESLVPLADTDKKKEDLFSALQQIWQELDSEELVDCDRIMTALVCDLPRLRVVFEAAKALRVGEPDAAIEVLDSEKAEADPTWLQLRSNALLQKDLPDEAVDYLLIAARRTGDPVLLRRTADLAFHVKKIDIARECYEQFLELQPDSLAVHGNLASIYAFHLHDLGRTSIHLQALHDAEPENAVHTVNLAICLSQLYRPEESLRLYEEACAQDKPDIRAILGRAELHLSLADPDAALAALQDFRETAWNEPEFLMSYMNAAYAAGDEEAAQEAFAALDELRKAGAVDSDAFRVIPADEGLAMLKQNAKHAQERTELLHTEMPKGRAPWIWAESVLGNALYWGWRTRTQVMPWILDDPANRARFSVYATNAFHPRSSGEDEPALLPLECPCQGTCVVADISSLFALHRLGLLDVAAGYFGEILVPEGYLPIVLEDSRKMVFHQRSRHTNLARLTKGIEAETIAVRQEEASHDAEMALVDEYGEPDGHHYHLVDLIEPVYKAGAINDADYKRLLEVCTKKSAVDDVHPELMQFQRVLVELSSLETVASMGLLDAVVQFYKVAVTPNARFEVRQRLKAIRDQEETLGWHFDLWDQIRGDGRFKFIHSLVPASMSAKRGDSKDHLSLLGCFVAQELGIPLLADDRVCQALALTNRPDVEHPAFGTAALISALANSRRMDASEAAGCIRQLMQWRYRFLLPSAAMLKALAAQYRMNPPGQALHEVAEYVHDCMRDGGLFGGPEKTALKDSMATRLYLSWVTTIADFLVEVWNDQSFTDESAKRLTDWSIQELLPSPPRVLHGQNKARLSALTARWLISQALIASTRFPQDGRSADAVKAMREALALTNDEYLRIMTEILDDRQ